jgi:tRNA-dihydrouridine synthase A
MHCPSPLCAVLAFLSTTISALALSNSNNLSSRRSNDYGIGTSATHKKYEDLTINNSKLSLAPMMNYTNRHFRAMIRLISSHTLLYTEMVAVDELLSTRQCDIHNLLGQSPVVPEGPSVLQLGGNDSSQIYQAANLYYKQSQTNELKYTSLNLNCGCPSLAVSGKKCFGAALMKDPLHVATLVRAMHEGVNGDLPISIKCRIGLHNDDATPFTPDMYNKQSQKEYDKLHSFIDTIAADGIVTNFIIHARIAVLGRGFSAADNRKIPPLNYDFVRRLTSDFPGLRFVLNGGIHSLHRAKEELEIMRQ